MEDNNAQQKKGMALIILSAVLFGFMPLFAKIAYAHGNNAYTLAFHRFFFGSIVMFLIVHFVQKNSLRIKPREMKSIFYLSLPFALHRCCSTPLTTISPRDWQQRCIFATRSWSSSSALSFSKTAPRRKRSSAAFCAH